MGIKITPTTRVEKDYPWDNPEPWITPGKIYAAISDLGIGGTKTTEDLMNAIGNVVQMYPADFAPLGEHRPPSGKALWSMETAIRNWLNGIKVVDEEIDFITERVALCVFNSPSLRGAKTIYGKTETHEGGLGWNIEVLGTGFGADATVAISNTSEFTSSSGDRKLVFAPLKIRVARVSLYKRGVFQKSFLRAELAETEVHETNGLRSVSPTEWPEFISAARRLDRFDLSGDTSNDIAKFKRGYTMRSSFESKLGLKVFDLETSIVAKCTVDQTTEMTFELPPGKVYELYEPSSIYGFVFS